MEWQRKRVAAEFVSQLSNLDCSRVKRWGRDLPQTDIREKSLAANAEDVCTCCWKVCVSGYLHNGGQGKSSACATCASMDQGSYNSALLPIALKMSETAQSVRYTHACPRDPVSVNMIAPACTAACSQQHVTSRKDVPQFTCTEYMYSPSILVVVRDGQVREGHAHALEALQLRHVEAVGGEVGGQRDCSGQRLPC